MRPIDKGESPYRKIGNYQEAEPYLNKRIGRYCSFCEMPIFHVPEVEHREGKASGGDLTAWENLLYGCKYCNTRKAQKIKAGEADKWIWPDKDKRWQRRIATLGIAEDCKSAWLKMKDSEFKEDELKQIVTMAMQTGFFSIWMMVFRDDNEMKCELVKAFPGTATKYFDMNV